METDDILERYADGDKANLNLSLLPDEKDDEVSRPTIFIQGPSRALRLLGELLIAIADSDRERDCSADPRGAGSFHFDPSSEFGFYINRVDK